MNYSKVYDDICKRAVNRIKDPIQYYERHHILPKSLGGLNTKDNLVYLTGREHFICHWLLTKFTSGKDYYMMVNAWNKITFSARNYQKRYIPSSRVYEFVRKEWGKTISKLNKGKLAGSNNPTFGKPRSEETKHRISIAKKGTTPWNTGLTKETNLIIAMATIKSGKTRKGCLGLKGSANGMFGKKNPNGCFQKGHIAWNKGIPRSEETKRKISNTKRKTNGA
jgi:hypothetical protein